MAGVKLESRITEALTTMSSDASKTWFPLFMEKNEAPDEAKAEDE